LLAVYRSMVLKVLKVLKVQMSLMSGQGVE